MCASGDIEAVVYGFGQRSLENNNLHKDPKGMTKTKTRRRGKYLGFKKRRETHSGSRGHPV